MMKNRFKRLNKLQIISTILLTISFIMTLCNVYNSNNLFWLCIGLNMSGFLLFTMKLSNEGKTWYSKIDKKYSKNLTRKPSDTIFYMLGAYYILVCIVVIGDMFIENFMNESILALYVIAILCNYYGLVIVDKTMKEVTSLIETSGRGKKKIKKAHESEEK